MVKSGQTCTTDNTNVQSDKKAVYEYRICIYALMDIADQK